MPLMRAPKLERKHLLALKTLVRLDFARAVRFKMDSLQKTAEHPAESTLKMLTLTDMMLDADQPLSITITLMEMHGSTEALMPLNDEKFKFYSATLNVEVGGEDFKGVPQDKLDTILAPLRKLQAELKDIFLHAPSLDPKDLVPGRRGATQDALNGSKPGMMN